MKTRNQFVCLWVFFLGPFLFGQAELQAQESATSTDKDTKLTREIVIPVRLDRATLSGLDLKSVTDRNQPNRKLFQKRLFRGADLSVYVVSSESASADHESYGIDEFLYLINGGARMKARGGNEAAFRTGDFFVAPKGFQGEWETIGGGKHHHELSVITTERNTAQKLSADGQPYRLDQDELSGIGIEIPKDNNDVEATLFEGAEITVQMVSERPHSIEIGEAIPEQVIHVLVGSLELTPVGEEPQSFYAGDFLVVPANFQGTWKSDAHDLCRYIRITKTT